MASLKEMRTSNRILLLRTLRRAGEADRATLARMTGVSRATISGLLGEAIARGFVVEEGVGRRGRPAMLRLDPRAGVVVGVDLGHSHVAAVLADLEGTVVGERRVLFDVDAAPDAALGVAVGLVEEIAESLGIDPGRLVGVGLGVARPVVRATGASPSPLGWPGASPGEELSRRLGLPVRLENDANVGVLGERARGAARGARDVVYLKLSTGVGAGLLLDGALYAGSRGVAGDIGHVTVVENGHICGCGNRGCLETVASAGALARALAPSHGDALTLPRLLELVDQDDPVAERGMKEIGRHIGRALVPLCLALDVELVVLGGELGATSRRLLTSVRAELRRTDGARQSIPVRPALLGDRAEALGAVELALGQEEWFHQAGLITLHGAAELRRAATA